MTKRILLVGASVRAQVESAVRAGYEVYAFDFFSDWDANEAIEASPLNCRIQKIADFEDPRIFDAAQECDAAIVLGGFETKIDLVERLPQATTILGTSPDNLKRLNREVEVFHFLHKNNVLCPETKTHVSELTPNEWIRKKIGSASGVGIRSASELDASIDQPNVYYQRRIQGSSISAVFASWSSADFMNETSLLFLSSQLVGFKSLGAQEYCYCGSIAQYELHESARAKILNCGTVLANEYNIRGVWGVDFVVNETGAYPVDVNCRITASAELAESLVAFNSSSKSIVDLHVHCCKHGVDSLTVQTVLPAVGKVILFNRFDRPITISNSVFKDLKAQYRGLAAGEDSPKVDGGRIADIPRPMTKIQPGHPILTLLGSRVCQKSTEKTLLEKAETIYTTLENCIE